MTKRRFCGVPNEGHICGKRISMTKKFFNIIPSEGESACLLLYGPVGEDQKVSPAQVVTELMELQRVYRKIDIRINSVGGEVFAGIAIFNALTASKADITIYIDGIAASIAAIIALCGKPLYMSNHARLMLHRVRGGDCGTADELRAAASTMERLENTLAEMIAAKCKCSAEEVSAKYFDGVDHWFTAAEAKELGLIEGIYDIDDDNAPGADATNDDIYKFFTNRLSGNGWPLINNKNMAFIDDLKARPSFKNATTEEQLMAEIARLENSAAKVSALEGKVAELTAQIAESRKAAHTALLDQAVTEGKITEAQKPAFLSLLDTDEENAKSILSSLPLRKAGKQVEQFIDQHGDKKSDILSMSWDEIDKANRLAELKSNYPEVYQQKFDEAFKK